MRVLMIYDTVSEAKATGKVAETVAAAMKEAGVPVEARFVGDANEVNVKDYDCLIVGAPTMAWRPSKRMKDFLAGLKGSDLSGKVAATFDTQMKSSISGNATKHMEKGLTALGCRIIVPSLIAYVETENKRYKLKDGELEKAKAWGMDLARALSK
jgi:flavodoxin